MKTNIDWTYKFCDICNVSFSFIDENGIRKIMTISGRKGIAYCPKCIEIKEG